MQLLYLLRSLRRNPKARSISRARHGRHRWSPVRCKVSATRQMLLTTSVSLALGPVAAKLGDRPASSCVTHASPAQRRLSSSRNPTWLPQFYLLENPPPRQPRSSFARGSPAALLQTLHSLPTHLPRLPWASSTPSQLSTATALPSASQRRLLKLIRWEASLSPAEGA